jgi:uncharacterized protein (TIGR00369 family)
MAGGWYDRPAISRLRSGGLYGQLIRAGPAGAGQSALQRSAGRAAGRVFAGGAELRLEIRPELLQQHGHVHGEALSYLADNALTFAGGSVLGPNVLTSGFTISYARPARSERLVARATVVSAGRRQAVCRCDVFAVAGGEETLCAVTQVVTGD